MIMRPYQYANKLVQALPPELSHTVALLALRGGLYPRARGRTEEVRACLSQQVAGLHFINPVGMAAGFDKNAEVMHALWKIGFGAVEVGTITPQPQPGNPRPRVFRLPEEQGVINRYGFNGQGIAACLPRIKKAFEAQDRGVFGINIGKNKLQEDAVADYRHMIEHAYAYADYITINLSSPNTPGLRNLLDEDNLKLLLAGMRAAREKIADKTQRYVPFFLKLSPDMEELHIKQSIDVAAMFGINGLIVSNTTIERSMLPPACAYRDEIGGLSGAPLKARACQALEICARHLKGALPLIAVGGIDSADEAWRRIGLGASLLQLYTPLLYHGLGLVEEINSGLHQRCQQNGYSNISQAVGKML